MTDAVRGRFAPTPSGALHAGSLRTAALSAMSAWSAGGRWILRIEDLDAARTPPGAVDAMLDELRWSGLAWDEGPFFQHAQADRYAAMLDGLRAAGLAYPCACSRRDVEVAAQAPHAAEPVYPGTCRDAATDDVLARAARAGRGVSWRFRIPRETKPIRIDDAVAGTFVQDVARDVGDFVVVRADGVAAYQLAVVADDLAMGITEVVRGDDLLASTPRQVLLYRALGAREPRWAHVPLVIDATGERLAKRRASMSLAALRARGISADRVRRWVLDSSGVPDRGSFRASAEGFDITTIRREPAGWPEVFA